MSKNRKLKKKIKRTSESLFKEGSVWGFDFDEIVTNGRKVSASGDYLGYGSVKLLAEFNKKAKLTDVEISVRYYDADLLSVQEWDFSNYKKYSKSVEKPRFKDKYVLASNYIGLGTQQGVQIGVDLLEEIPGVENLTFSYISSSMPSFSVT